MNGPLADCPSAAPRRKWSVRELVTAACRIFAGVVFLMAAVTKITALREFSDQLVLHSGFPCWLSQGVALVLPWLELTCGFCLLFGLAKREAAALGTLMLSSFTVFLLFHRSESSCGCLLFPQVIPPALLLPSLLVRNGAMLVCCVYLVHKPGDAVGFS